jgi:hypothetical protein
MATGERSIKPLIPARPSSAEGRASAVIGTPRCASQRAHDAVPAMSAGQAQLMALADRVSKLTRSARPLRAH